MRINQLQCDGCKLTFSASDPETFKWFNVRDVTGSPAADLCPDCFAKTGAKLNGDD